MSLFTERQKIKIIVIIKGCMIFEIYESYVNTLNTELC